MQIYLPIAEISVQIYWIILLGMFSGLMAGMFGIGGNFISIPTLIFMGIPPTVALSSCVNQTVGSSFASFINHFKRGNVDLEVAIYLFLGSLIGTVSGSIVFKLLKGAGYMDVVIFFIYILILGIMGTISAVESIRTIIKNIKKTENTINITQNNTSKIERFIKTLPLQRKFNTSGIETSIIAIACSGMFVSFLVALSGVGGGFILVPALIYIFSMPTTIAIGTSVFQAMFSTVIITFLHAATVKTVDIMLAVLLLLGALVGVNIGVRFSSILKPEFLRLLLATIILFGFFRMIFALFITQDDLYSFTIINSEQVYKTIDNDHCILFLLF